MEGFRKNGLSICLAACGLSHVVPPGGPEAPGRRGEGAQGKHQAQVRPEQTGEQHPGYTTWPSNLAIKR